MLSLEEIDQVVQSGPFEPTWDSLSHQVCPDWQILPFLRQDGQVCNVPLYILLPVGTGRRKFHQMPDTPTYKIAVALKVAILPPMHT